MDWSDKPFDKKEERNPIVTRMWTSIKNKSKEENASTWTSYPDLWNHKGKGISKGFHIRLVHIIDLRFYVDANVVLKYSHTDAHES